MPIGRFVVIIDYPLPYPDLASVPPTKAEEDLRSALAFTGFQAQQVILTCRDLGEENECESRSFRHDLAAAHGEYSYRQSHGRNK